MIEPITIKTTNLKNLNHGNRYEVLNTKPGYCIICINDYYRTTQWLYATKKEIKKDCVIAKYSVEKREFSDMDDEHCETCTCKHKPSYYDVVVCTNCNMDISDASIKEGYAPKYCFNGKHVDRMEDILKLVKRVKIYTVKIYFD